MTFRPLPVDPRKSAVLAGLRYVRPDSPGFTRKATANGFQYFDADGRLIRDTETLQRIKSLVIPPAWNNVWICPLERGRCEEIGFSNLAALLSVLGPRVDRSPTHRSANHR